VNTQRSSRVVIDIVQATGTVSGRVAVGDQTATEFFGWLELIDRLQSAAGTPAHRSDPSVEEVIRVTGTVAVPNDPRLAGPAKPMSQTPGYEGLG
jgi:hypothetical protein